jgi:hypothetical protein
VNDNSALPSLKSFSVVENAPIVSSATTSETANIIAHSFQLSVIGKSLPVLNGLASMADISVTSLPSSPISAAASPSAW